MRDRWIERALGAIAVGSGLLPVASATAAHAASYPVTPQRVLAVAAVFASLSWVVYAVARRISGSQTRAAAATLVWSLLIFAYPLVAAFPRTAVGVRAEEAFGALYLGLAATLAALVLRSRQLAEPLNAMLSTMIAFVLATSIVGLTIPRYLRSPPFHVPGGPPAGASRPDAATRRPNIYHLVLDGLGRPDVLRARYELDVGDAVSALAALGFVVEGNATTNYAQTYLSIASMLNADYIDVPADSIAEHSRTPVHEAIQNNTVFSTLRQHGYEIVFLASDYSATSESRLASTCWCPPILFGEFESSVLYRTPLRAWLPGTLDYLPHRHRVEGVLQRLAASVPSTPGAPRYTFAHILSPHPPFMLQADGTFVPPRRGFSFLDGSLYPGDAAEYRAGYARQAQYLLRRTVAIASALRQNDPEAVVIVSGDHGPRLRFHANDARRTDAREVFPIFLAIRWGAGAEGGAGHVDSPVNLYREIFRRSLGLRVPALPDRSYVSSFLRPYDLIEVDRRALVP